MTTNLEQTVDDLRVGLRNSGVGSFYLHRTLKEYAPDLFAALNDSIFPGVREGRGMILVGKAKSYDETMLLARSTFLSRITTMVTPLVQLVKWIAADSLELEMTINAQALFVLNFADNCECPLTRRERYHVEELVGWRVDNGQAFFAQGACTVGGSGWWTDGFVERVDRATIVRVCGESGPVSAKGNN